MLKLMRIELYKLFKRKDALVIYSMMLIPLLYSIGFSRNVENITYKGGANSLSAIEFADDMFAFGFYLFIFLICVALSMVNSYRGEVDTGSITLLINKSGDRKKIYFAKLASQFVYLMIFTVLFMIFSIACYYLFLRNSDIATGKFLAEDTMGALFRISGVVLIYFWAITLAGLFSTKFNIFGSMGLFVLVWAILMYAKEFSAVRFLSPVYHLSLVMENSSLHSILMLGAVLSIYMIIMLTASVKLFEGSDLC